MRIIILAYVFITIIGACNDTGKEKVISINYQHDSDSTGWNTNPDEHKPNDLQIDWFKMMGSPYYWITTYRMDSGRLKAFTEFGFESHKIFDKATYKWINDSTLNIKMINSSNDSTLSCSLVLHNNGSSSFGNFRGLREY